MAKTTFRYDSYRFSDTATADRFVSEILKTSRKKLDGSWADIQLAAELAADEAAEQGRWYIGEYLDRVDTGKMRDSYRYRVQNRDRKKLSLRIGWVDTQEDYFDWQERGTYGNRSRTPKSLYDRGSRKASGGIAGTGIYPMHAKEYTKEVFRSELDKNMRSLNGR